MNCHPPPNHHPATPPPFPRWVQQFTVSSFLPAALCVFLCFSYRRHVAPRQEPPPSAGACCPSPHLISPRTPPPPPSTRLSCRLSGRDGRVPAGRRPASSALATSLRANTYFSPHSGASRGTARPTRPPWQWKFTGWQRWEVTEYTSHLHKYFITVLKYTFQALFKVKKSKSKSIFSHVQDIQISHCPMVKTGWTTFYFYSPHLHTSFRSFHCSRWKSMLVTSVLLFCLFYLLFEVELFVIRCCVFQYKSRQILAEDYFSFGVTVQYIFGTQ